MVSPKPSDAPRTVRVLRKEGVTTLVSVVTIPERWAVDSMPFEHFWLPVPEHGVPRQADAAGVLPALAERLRAGAHVVISCRLALGRSPMVAAALLCAMGLSPDDAEAAVTKARRRKVPAQATQRAWVREWASAVHSH